MRPADLPSPPFKQIGRKRASTGCAPENNVVVFDRKTQVEKLADDVLPAFPDSCCIAWLESVANNSCFRKLCRSIFRKHPTQNQVIFFDDFQCFGEVILHCFSVLSMVTVLAGYSAENLVGPADQLFRTHHAFAVDGRSFLSKLRCSLTHVNRFSI